MINVNGYPFSFCSQFKSSRDNIVADIDDVGIQKQPIDMIGTKLILTKLKA